MDLLVILLKSENDFFISVLKVLGPIFGIGFVLWVVIAHVNMTYEITKDTKVVKGIRNKIEDIKEEKALTKEVKKQRDEYLQAKHTFKYMSNEKLFGLYQESLMRGDANMERLALEEALVERGVIENSPMHEKMYHLKKMFD